MQGFRDDCDYSTTEQSYAVRQGTQKSCESTLTVRSTNSELQNFEVFATVRQPEQL